MSIGASAGPDMVSLWSTQYEVLNQEYSAKHASLGMWRAGHAPSG